MLRILDSSTAPSLQAAVYVAGRGQDLGKFVKIAAPTFETGNDEGFAQ